MIDTHAHLNFDDYEGKVPDIIEACRQANIHSIILPGTGLAMSQTAVELAEKYDPLYAAVGVHPADIIDEEITEEDAESIVSQLSLMCGRSKKVKAIGEIGLDRYYIYRKFGEFKKDLFNHQVNLFTIQFRLAKDLHKAVIIHNRQSKNDLIPLLENEWDAFYANKVVFHFCEADDQLLEFALAHDIYIGVDGDVTFSSERQAFVHKVPLNRIVLETDSPFITPSPPRDNPETKYPNSPEHLPLIAQKIAEIKGVDVRTVERETDQNARNLFDL